MNKQIYSPWAFTSNAQEKKLINLEIYDEIKDKGEVIYETQIINVTNEMKKEKAYLVFDGYGYAHQRYRILSNPNNLSIQQLALICDDGNLCFGYSLERSVIKIYTD